MPSFRSSESKQIRSVPFVFFFYGRTNIDDRHAVGSSTYSANTPWFTSWSNQSWPFLGLRMVNSLEHVLLEPSLLWGECGSSLVPGRVQRWTRLGTSLPVSSWGLSSSWVSRCSHQKWYSPVDLRLSPWSQRTWALHWLSCSVETCWSDHLQWCDTHGWLMYPQLAAFRHDCFWRSRFRKRYYWACNRLWYVCRHALAALWGPRMCQYGTALFRHSWIGGLSLLSWQMGYRYWRSVWLNHPGRN